MNSSMSNSDGVFIEPLFSVELFENSNSLSNRSVFKLYAIKYRVSPVTVMVIGD